MEAIATILQKRVMPAAFFSQSIAGRTVVPKLAAAMMACSLPGDESLVDSMILEPAVATSLGKLVSRIVSAGFNLQPGTGSGGRTVFKLVRRVIKACEVWEGIVKECARFPAFGWKPIQLIYQPGAISAGWGIRTISALPSWQFYQTPEDTLVRYAPPDPPTEYLDAGLQSWIIARAGLTGWPYGEWGLGAAFVPWWLRGLMSGRMFTRRHVMGPVATLDIGPDSPLNQPGGKIGPGGGKPYDVEAAREIADAVLEVLEESGVLVNWPDCRFQIMAAQGRSDPEATQLFTLLGQEIERALTLEHQTSGEGTSLAGGKTGTEATIGAAILWCTDVTALLRMILRKVAAINFGEDVDPDDLVLVTSRLSQQINLAAAQAIAGWGGILDLHQIADAYGVPLAPSSPLEGTGQAMTSLETPGLPGERT